MKQMLSNCFLVVDNKQIPLLHKHNLIGKNPNALVHIENSSMAKEHAIIKLNDNFQDPTLIDVSQVGGCYINGVKLEKQGQKKLNNGDILQFGNYEKKYEFVIQEEQNFRDSLNQSMNQDQVSQSEEQIQLGSGMPQSYAQVDHLQNVFEQNNLNNFKRNFEFQDVPSKFQDIKFKTQEDYQDQVQPLLDQEKQLMQEKATQMMLRQQRHDLDKQMTVNQIVEEEKNILNERFKQDVQRLQKNNMQQVQQLEQHMIQTKNKNEKLERLMVEKEASLLELQNENAKLVDQTQSLSEQNEILEVKLKALQNYTSQLQQRNDILQHQDNQKQQALNELMQNDIPAKLVEYKKQIEDLRQIIMQKDKEKDQFYSNYQLGSDQYSKQILEKQAQEIVNLQKALEEYERRDNVCEKKWTSLINENQLNMEQASQYRIQLERQRESYNRLLTMTEKRVIQANQQINQVFSIQDQFSVDSNKKIAAEFLTQQIYELYEERKRITGERDDSLIENNELQRINAGLRIEIEKYKQIIDEDYNGQVQCLFNRIEELQDLLIQQKNIESVNLLVDGQAQIRALNMELAKKTQLIENMKIKLQSVNLNKKKDIKNDDDIIDYLVGLIKEKESIFQEQQFKINSLLQKESNYKDQIEKYEIIYGDNEDKKLSKYEIKEQISQLQSRDTLQSLAQIQNQNNVVFMKEQQQKSEWLYF